MKRFKQYLIEEMATDKVAPEATNTTPLSSVTPPAPAMFAPDSVKQQYQNYITQAQQGPYLAKGNNNDEPYDYEYNRDPVFRTIPEPGPGSPRKPRRDGLPIDLIPREEWDDVMEELWREYERRRDQYEYERREYEEKFEKYEREREEWLRNLEKIYGINPKHPYWRHMFDYQWRYRQWEQGGRFGNPPQPPIIPPDKWEGPMPRFQDYDRNGDGILDNDENERYSRDLERWRQEFERQFE